MIVALQFILRYRKLLAVLGGLILLGAVFGAGYVKGTTAGQKTCLRAEIKTQTARAKNAEKQRDIANAPPASIDDVLEWLSSDRTD